MLELSSTNILTVVSTKFFKTFPCSADKGSMVPPVVRSSTYQLFLTLSLIAVVLSAIPDVFCCDIGAILQQYLLYWY